MITQKNHERRNSTAFYDVQRQLRHCEKTQRNKYNPSETKSDSVKKQNKFGTSNTDQIFKMASNLRSRNTLTA